MSKLTFSLFCRFVTLGDSPYERDTFRYSPVLAFTCVLNVTSHPLVGKAFFVVWDLVSWVLIKKVLSQQGGSETKSLSAAYLFNPYTITMSTRCSCESLTAFLLMLIVCCLQCEYTFRAASCFAFATLFACILSFTQCRCYSISTNKVRYSCMKWIRRYPHALMI